MLKSKLFQVFLGAAMMINATFATFAADFKPIKFEKEVIDNGLTVIYYVDNSAPIVSTVMHYNVGSKDEDLDKTGYAHFFEHLMFEATDAIPRATIDKNIQAAGGELNAYTAFDQTVYHFTVPSNEIKLALWMESQRMRRLHVDEIGVETQRGVVTEELKTRTVNQPYGTLLQKFCSATFPGSGYSWQVIGSEEHIKRATIQNFKDFYDNFYQPNNATLVIAGDFKVSDAKQYVRDFFSQYPKGKEPKRHTYNLQALTKEYRETVEDDKAPMTALFIGYQGPTMKDKEYYAASLLSDILSAGESSRLYQRLVDKEQLSVGVEFSPFIFKEAGAFFVQALVAHGKTPEEVEKILNDEFAKLAKEGVTDEELTKAKNIRETSFVFGKKGLMDIAQDLARYQVFFGDAGLINSELDKYMKVTKDDILKVAQKYLTTKNKVVLLYQPKNS